jgi:5-aminopentanamidase
MKLAVWQGNSPAGNGDAALAALEPALNASGAMGAAMLVAPEVWLPGYNDDRIHALAQPRGGPWTQALAKLCRAAGCGIVVGYAERDGDTVYNAAMVLDASGAELAHYRKIQLYGPREKGLYSPGQAYTTFPLGNVKAGLLICYDIEFSAHVGALAAMGVDVILAPTANMQPFVHVVRHTVPAMAANHGVTIAYANFCGVEGDLTYVGGSQIVGPHGEVLALAGEGPALLVADLPARDPARVSTQAIDLRHI